MRPPGDLEAMANYAGQSVGLVRRVQPAVDIVREVADEARGVLAQLASGTSDAS